MISIITAIHNQLPMNRVFVSFLQRYTTGPYELVVIDNDSTDGSGAFFKSKGAKVITNSGNYGYSYCQNQGIAASSGEYLMFLNNDVIVSPAWDTNLIAILESGQADIVSAAAPERMETKLATSRMMRKWKWISNPIRHFSTNERAIFAMFRVMYPNWERFCEKRKKQFQNQLAQGMTGFNIMLHRKTLEKVGLWDERMQAADWDLYMRTYKRYIDFGDVKPMQVALGVFMHHYVRFTVKTKYQPFVNQDQIIDFKEKWLEEVREPWLEIFNQHWPEK